MPKLYRPSIPLEVRCRVALRQLGYVKQMEDVIKMHRPRKDAGYMVGVVGFEPGGHGLLLKRLLQELADQLECPVEALRLDHDPALGTRMKRTVGHPPRTIYSPDANDPDHLKYRPHGAEYAGSHDVKTRIRGDHGQYSDIALIKRERRRERKAGLDKNLKKKRPKWRSPPKGKSGKAAKYVWPKRPFRSKKSPT